MERKKSGEREEKNSEIPVTDKRFWVKEKEEMETEEPGEKYPTFVEELRDKLRKKDDLLKDYIASFKRFEKENEKFRNRLEKDLARKVDREKSKFISKFLDIMDNLDRAIGSSEKNQNNQSLIEGIIMIQTQFYNFLKNEGVEPIETLGKEFDPNVGEAIEVISVSKKEDDNKVLDEIQKGYKMSDQLIRPAKVKVGKLIQKTSQNDN
jgi:molecular chaperone GrpE